MTKPNSSPVIYLSYLLRLWYTADDAATSQDGWRASLESVQTGERRGFASLDELLAHLKQIAEAEVTTTKE
ncbi:MAG: hypothetical protein R3C14_50610 [Caldilineaceae bacterium]